MLDVAAPMGVGDVQCPDKSTCPDGNTCCMGTDGGYDCCTLPDANCCDDYKSCCASGTVCDVINGKCITPSLEVLDRIPLMKSSGKRRL